MYYIYLRGCWGCRVPGGQGVRAPATVIGFGLIPSDGAQCLEKRSLHGLTNAVGDAKTSRCRVRTSVGLSTAA